MQSDKSSLEDTMNQKNKIWKYSIAVGLPLILIFCTCFVLALYLIFENRSNEGEDPKIKSDLGIVQESINNVRPDEVDNVETQLPNLIQINKEKTIHFDPLFPNLRIIQLESWNKSYHYGSNIAFEKNQHYLQYQFVKPSEIAECDNAKPKIEVPPTSENINGSNFSRYSHTNNESPEQTIIFYKKGNDKVNVNCPNSFASEINSIESIADSRYYIFIKLVRNKEEIIDKKSIELKEADSMVSEMKL